MKNLKENVIGTELGKVVAPKGKLLKVQYMYVCILFALKFGVKQVNKAQTLKRLLKMVSGVSALLTSQASFFSDEG